MPDVPSDFNAVPPMQYAAFDIAVGRAALTSQNEGDPRYNLSANSIFWPDRVVEAAGVKPTRFWTVATIGPEVSPVLGFYIPAYDFPTDNGWVWFVLHEKIDFQDCEQIARGFNAGDGQSLAAMVAVLTATIGRQP